jgi:hypothetical protein
MEYGIIGLIVLALDVWAIISTFRSPASDPAKILWALLILVLPVVGLIAWAFSPALNAAP